MFRRMSLVGLVVVVVLALGAAPTLAQSNSEPLPTISVTGTGQAFGAPDIAFVNLGADRVEPTVGAAVEGANQVLNAIVSALSGLGIAPEDIQTTGYNLFPEDRYDPTTGQSTGRNYRAILNITVTVRDISQVSAVLTSALEAGATTINGLNFSIEDVAALEQQARAQAIADARERAEQLAAAFGVTLGAPVTISEGFVNAPIPMAQTAMQAGFGGGGGGGPSVNPGQLSVTVQIGVTFAMESSG